MGLIFKDHGEVGDQSFIIEQLEKKINLMLDLYPKLVHCHHDLKTIAQGLARPNLPNSSMQQTMGIPSGKGDACLDP